MIRKEKLHAIAPLNRRRLKGYSSPSQGQIKRAAKSSGHVVGILRASIAIRVIETHRRRP
jgi:hypothetical protein